jgi:hypothetical protein
MPRFELVIGWHEESHNHDFGFGTTLHELCLVFHTIARVSCTYVI